VHRVSAQPETADTFTKHYLAHTYLINSGVAIYPNKTNTTRNQIATDAPWVSELKQPKESHVHFHMLFLFISKTNKKNKQNADTASRVLVKNHRPPWCMLYLHITTGAQCYPISEPILKLQYIQTTIIMY